MIRIFAVALSILFAFPLQAEQLTVIAPSGGGGGGITIGAAVNGGTPSTLLYVDAAGDVADGATTSVIGPAFASGTITTSQPMTLTQTWNDGAVTFVGASVDITATASAAASLVQRWRVGGSNVAEITKAGAIYSGASGDGFFGVGGAIDLRAGGNSYFRLSSVYLRLDSGIGFGWGTGVGSGNDLILVRDAANTLAQRNGTAAQALRVYNTFTDASNYERGTIAWNSNRLDIGPEAAGTGTLRSIGMLSHVLFPTDNTYDIGASGATRPRDIFVADDVVAGGDGTFTGELSGNTVDTNGFAIGSLPTPGVAGRRAYVTDQITACPVPGAAPTAGGALVCPVFDNGVAWVGG